MLPEKPWKLDAIARLLMSGIICICAASVLVTMVYHGFHHPKPDWRVFAQGGGACVVFGVALALVARPWALETFMLRMAFTMASLLVGLVLGMGTESLAGTPPRHTAGAQMLLVEIAALFLLARFVREHDVTWADVFGLHRQPGRAALAGLVIVIIMLPIVLLLQAASNLVISHFEVEPAKQEAIEVLIESRSWISRAPLAIVAVFFAPLVEEVLFRGILYTAIKQAGFPRLAVAGSAVLFSAIHFNLPTFLPLLALAVALVAIYERTQNLLAPIVAHCVFNLVNVSRLFLVLNDRV